MRRDNIAFDKIQVAADGEKITVGGGYAH